MSDVKVNLDETDAKSKNEEEEEPREDPEIPAGSASTSDAEGLTSALNSSDIDCSPPDSEQKGLLSLPWEILSYIASHLPAQCVHNVLPKVCRALRSIGKDNTAWQLRARRLIGSRGVFPVGPRKDFAWTTACLEMEQLITYWTGEIQHVAKRTESNVGERRQERPQEREENAEREDDVREDVDGVGVAAQEVAYGADEGVEVAVEGEDHEMHPHLDEDQIGRLRELLHDRLERHAVALVEDEGMDLQVAVGENAGMPHRENPADPGNQEEQVEMIQPQSPRSPSPPPILEHILLPTAHIAQVNSVLLLGGEGAICASASRDWNVKLWDLRDGPNGALLHALNKEGEFTTHRGWVWCLASEGHLLASGGFDSTVRQWDLQAGGADVGMIRTEAAVLCLSCQGNTLLTGTFDKKISMYDTRASDSLIKSIRLHNNAVMCLSADDKYIISGSKDCTVAVYDRCAGKILKKIKLRSYLLSLSHSGDEIWAGDNKGMLHSFSMHTGSLNLLSQFDVGHNALINGIHKSPGSLYTCSSDHTVKIHIPCGPPRTLRSLHFESGVHGLSVEAGVLAVATGDVNVEVWRPQK